MKSKRQKRGRIDKTKQDQVPHQQIMLSEQRQKIDAFVFDDSGFLSPADVQKTAKLAIEQWDKKYSNTQKNKCPKCGFEF
jgi:hypothetical protein